MKKLLPFVFPLLAAVLVVFLGYRWYSTQVTRPEGRVGESNFAEGVKIEELSQDELNKLNQGGVKDAKSIELQGSDQATGQVRYEVQGDKINFSVFANVPELKEGKYQVWLKEVNSENKQKAFTLEMTKAGYTGSAAVATSLLPFEVVVTRETNVADDTMESTVLKGTIQKQ